MLSSDLLDTWERREGLSGIECWVAGEENDEVGFRVSYKSGDLGSWSAKVEKREPGNGSKLQTFLEMVWTRMLAVRCEIILDGVELKSNDRHLNQAS